MANKTLLNATNEILKRVGVIAGDAGVLASLTDGSRQRAIDVAVQIVNEGIDELYSSTHIARGNEQKQGTLTLVTSTRSYTLATDLVQLRWPMIDKTNTQFLYEYPGGYNAILLADPEQNDTGLPLYGAISPVDGKLQVDRAPTSAENGRIYTYQYDKDLALTLLTDTVPFSDAVFRAMVPTWAQLWSREERKDFDEALFKTNLGRAGRLMTQQQMRTHYCPR